MADKMRNWLQACLRLEVLLGIAGVALVLQLFPDLGLWLKSSFSRVLTGTLWALDVRHWSRTTWFLMNLGFVAVLLVVRFRAEIKAALAAVQGRPTAFRPAATSPEDQEEEYQARYQRDLDWRERARKRLPFQ